MSVELTYNNTETPIQDVPSFIKVLYKNLNSKKKVKKKKQRKVLCGVRRIPKPTWRNKRQIQKLDKKEILIETSFKNVKQRPAIS